jgi:protein-histidine pros-kinase
LGLALTKKIVELQKGTIDVETELGRGSTFTVVLPRSLEKVQPICSTLEKGVIRSGPLELR